DAKTTPSLASATSTAKRWPASVKAQARLEAIDPLGREAAHRLEQLLRGEGLAEVLVGALALPPHPVALLILRAHHHHRGVLGAAVPLDAAENLVAVALRHHDVEQQYVRLLFGDLVLELLAVDERHDLVAGRAQNALHHGQLGVRVVDDHHLAHGGCPLLTFRSTRRADRRPAGLNAARWRPRSVTEPSSGH